MKLKLLREMAQRCHLVLVFLVLLLNASINDAQTSPENDKCTTAIELQPNKAALPGTTVNSTAEALTCAFAAFEREVWYSVVGNGRTLTVTTCGTQEGPATTIQVFSGECGELECVTGSAGDFGRVCQRHPSAATVLFDSIEGQVYSIHVTADLIGSSDGAEFVVSLLDPTLPTLMPTEPPGTTPLAPVGPVSSPVTASPTPSSRAYNARAIHFIFTASFFLAAFNAIW